MTENKILSTDELKLQKREQMKTTLSISAVIIVVVGVVLFATWGLLHTLQRNNDSWELCSKYCQRVEDWSVTCNKPLLSKEVCETALSHKLSGADCWELSIDWQPERMFDCTKIPVFSIKQKVITGY